ncbi:MAG TPA: cation:proton antiporter [Candidatus Polarisedimenticolaceae bacterium]|nr:cation:proton antiporter [Candidatus Polarisedimenticolaceae bacterium]
MTFVLVYAATLLAAVLLSDLARRSVLSTAVLFLAVGCVTGPGVLGWIGPEASGEVVKRFAELALVTVLFTDGMKVGARDLARAWHLPGRALLLGLPLTLGLSAVCAHALFDLPWSSALLVASALAPTDPVLAAALVSRDEIPWTLRHLLNVESGLNDGLALPLVVITLAVASHRELHLGSLALEVAMGVVLGVVIPLAALLLPRLPFLGSHDVYDGLLVFAIGLLLFALGEHLHANTFLAAFAGGVTVATVSGRARDAFQPFGEPLAELLKLAALLVFGALLAPSLWTSTGLSGWIFALLVLLAARPLAIFAALAGSGMRRAQKLAAAWFGPKGFASVVFALLIAQSSSLPDRELLFHLAALTIALSMVLHASTDALVARWFGMHGGQAPAAGG